MTRTKADDYLFDSEAHVCQARDLLIGARALLEQRDEGTQEAAQRFVDDALHEVKKLAEMLYAATAKTAAEA